MRGPQIIDALALPPLDDGVRAVFMPSFHYECVVTVRSATIDVHAAMGSLTHAWPAPAIAHEHHDVGATLDLTAALAWQKPKEPSMVLDGMPVWLDLGSRQLDLWFSGDSKTPPGAVVIAMLRLAQAHCRWIATNDRLDHLLQYCDLR